ncbi:MAG: 3-methyl-2-oxobutanoate dehydrogenase subunit VorB [Calditrichaeota bacterium]|nr:MAG: 3-methyl-2-oxobutanoate dehydrogenase subunit VorB [Calditrichota bacterium]
MKKDLKSRPKPFLLAEYCKGCGRCIAACPKHCIEYSNEVNPVSGYVPVVIDYSVCNGCGLCLLACPEPYGLMPENRKYEFQLTDPAKQFGPRPTAETEPREIPDQVIPLPETEPLVVKGTYAAAIGALLAGCRHFFGYPITPSTEGAELMAKVLPHLDGVFVQAVSEVATVNHIYGCGGTGLRCMTFTSSPGFSLMLEGISYLIGAEVPGVFVNVMRGGPGLGNIAPEQGDIKLACRGLGHGNTHALVLAPADPQEMLDLTMLAFELSFRYRNPVIVLGDGYLGQVTGRVKLPRYMIQPGLPSWAVYGDREHRRNLICSIHLSEADLEAHNRRLVEKYRLMEENEQRADLYFARDAEILLVASNTPSRMVRGAVKKLRDLGVKAGLFRPITLWPFPIEHLKPLLPGMERLIVVEASNGQLEDELRLALGREEIVPHPPIHHIRHYGGVLPQVSEIVQAVLEEKEVEP